MDEPWAHFGVCGLLWGCSKAPFPAVQESQKPVVQVGFNHSLDLCRALFPKKSYFQVVPRMSQDIPWFC